MVASDNGPGNLSADDQGALSSCFDLRSVDASTVCNNERFLDKNAYISVLRLKRDVGKEEFARTDRNELRLHREAQ